MIQQLRSYTTFFARLALATAFLASVADRAGLWGPPGATGVSWGTFANFEGYTGDLLPFLPHILVPAAAWAATVAEATLGVALLAGFQTRWSALAGGALLLTFAASMGLFVTPEKPFAFSVFSAAAAAFLLAAAPAESYIWSTDHLLRGAGVRLAGGVRGEERLRA
ncbi:MAG TPA: hypothetical protein VFW96_22935 [Thermomicrobiales bacterium]|nr:hypothetical protein [Thermomicrobiales bacterium]